MSNHFDPQAFIDLPIETPLEKRPPLPVGDYTATVKEVTARAWQGKQDPTKSGMAYDVVLTVEVPEAVRVATGLDMPTLTLKDSIMLDLTENGALDTSKGRNNKLRTYREALDMNKPGEVFRASLMTGRLLKVRVSHEIYNDAPVERVAGVARL